MLFKRSAAERKELEVRELKDRIDRKEKRRSIYEEEIQKKREKIEQL
jgi:hypothetical protein